MKKSTSSYSSSTSKKPSVSKPLSTGRVLNKAGPGGPVPSAAAVNRRSPVVLGDQTIATNANSVHQAASDPKIKELVMKQKQEESRRESSKRPRADGFAPAVHHVLEHPNSAPHHSHQGQQFWKHNSFEGTESLNNTMNASLNDSSMLEGSFGKYSSAMPSPDAHQHPKHYQFLEQASGGTPGSALETVVANNTDNVGAGVARAHHDDDGVNSEITIETGYMAVYKVETSAYPQQGHQMGFTPNNSLGRAQGSGSGDHNNNNNGNMNMYVDMNNSLLHEHPHGGNLPLPPPLHLPVAAHPPSTNNTNSSGGAALTPTGHISTIGAAPTSQQAQEPLMLPDPRVLSDQALQDAYVRFLLEMETRGLQSMNINAAAALAPNQAPSPSVHYSAEVDNITRSASVAHRASSMLSVPSAPLPPHSSHGSQRPVPATAHTGLAAGVAGSNPADIRKHVKRSKSNGSEAAFPPSAMFPQSSASGAAAAASGVSSGSGRKTPNSPMLGRYNHSAYSAEGGVISYAQYLQQFGEPEEFELKDAFGQARHPGSPSYHSPYSPSHHLGSNAPAPSYYQAHGYLHSVPTQQQQAYGHTGGALGATPTSVAVGSANWSGANTGAYAATAHSFPTNPNLSSRAPSRCGGVQPPMAPDSRDELLELRPGLRTNCLSTLPSTYSQYMYANNNVAAHSSTNTNTGAGNNTTTSTPASMGQAIQNASDEASSASEQPRRIDLKTPKFVRSKFQGISAGLMGLSAALRFSSAEEEAEYTAATSAAAAIAASKSRTGAGASKSAAAHGAHAAGHGSTHTNRDDNKVDAVREAGGLDNLLLPGRAQHLRSIVKQSDEHSTFSQGETSAFSQPSLNSARSNGKKASKSRS